MRIRFIRLGTMIGINSVEVHKQRDCVRTADGSLKNQRFLCWGLYDRSGC